MLPLDQVCRRDEILRIENYLFKKMKVILFLTYGNSLETWEKAGILERELELYFRQIEKFDLELSIISYGKAGEIRYRERYPQVRILFNRFSLPTRVFAKLVPFLFFKSLDQADIFKTNQMLGAHVASVCASRFSKPLYVRQGYSLVESESRKWGASSAQARRALIYEKKIAERGAHFAFPATRMAQEFKQRHPKTIGKISVLPNYVVEEVWSPAFEAQRRSRSFRLAFMGKFTRQKNLPELIDACDGLDVELELIGAGDLARSIERQVAEQSQPLVISLAGRLPQTEACKRLRACSCFILPSIYEGQPKALLEAMALGMPVIGTNIEGVSELIEDGVTGFLAEPSVQGMRQVIIRVINMKPEDLERIGNAARAFVLENHELKRIVEDDFKIMQKLVAPGNA